MFVKGSFMLSIYCCISDADLADVPCYLMRRIKMTLLQSGQLKLSRHGSKSVFVTKTNPWRNILMNTSDGKGNVCVS